MEEKKTMRWAPQHEGLEEEELRHNFISEDTAKARWETEIEPKDNIVDNDFMKRNKYKINSINKFPALAFYNDYKYLLLRRNRNLQIAICAAEGLDDICEELVLDNIDDAQVSRGWNGNYTIAKITEIHKLQQELKQEQLGSKERIGRFSGLFRKKEENTQQDQLQPQGVQQ